MRMLNIFSLVAALMLCSINIAVAQDCGGANGGVGSGTVGGHRHFWPGPYGGPNCGRAYTQSQAEALWSGYCSEDCSLCGHGCGKGSGFLGHSTSACYERGTAGNGCSPLLGWARAHTGKLFGAGISNDCDAAPCTMGGKAFGHSSFGCQQWGWGNNSSDCGDSGSGGLCGHFHEIGRSGRFFRSTGCDSGCDNSGCDNGCDETNAAPTPPHQSATPTSFHRYHSDN